jgi:transposase-like protein
MTVLQGNPVMNLTDPIFTDEHKAREFIEATRWPNGPVCPHCGCTDKVYRLNGESHRDGLIYCNNCAGSFTATTGTVMESSHVPLHKWVLAYRLMSSAKKGISAHQIHRTIGVSYKTAWFMCHRIRESMRDTSGDMLGGPGKIVEADEVYVGGKPRKGTDGQATKADRKTPVAVLVERGGRARAKVVSHPLDGALISNIVTNVERGTEMHTDEHKSYRRIGKHVGGLHFSVNHSQGEYAREDIHNNTAESWNALLKRSIVGSFHHVSREHLSRYCDEVSFRWDRRKMDDTERTIQAIRGGEGKRLTYKGPRSAEPAGA